jgi:hypothetical protein
VSGRAGASTVQDATATAQEKAADLRQQGSHQFREQVDQHSTQVASGGLILWWGFHVAGAGGPKRRPETDGSSSASARARMWRRAATR